MHKMPRVEEQQEVKFLALPQPSQLLLKNPESKRVYAYRAALHAVQDAQRRAAVIAVEELRPADIMQARAEYRETVREAREKYQDAALAVFSEVCTKGL